MVDRTDGLTSPDSEEREDEALATTFVDARAAETPLERPEAEEPEGDASEVASEFQRTTREAIGRQFNDGTVTIATEDGRIVRQRVNREGFYIYENQGVVHYDLQQETMGDFWNEALVVLSHLIGGRWGEFSSSIEQFYGGGDNYVDPNDQDIFVEVADQVADGEVDRAFRDFQTGGDAPRINVTVRGENLNIPIGDRQTAVIEAIQQVSAGNQTTGRLMQAFWGAESVFGTALRSSTTAWGDFHFIQKSFAGIVNDRGNQIIADMRRDGYNAEADTLQGFIDRGEVGKSLSRHRPFLELRDDPVIATYAAYHLIDQKADAIGADPSNRADWGRIYMAYTTGEGTALLFSRLANRYPNINITDTILNGTAEQFGLDAGVLDDIKDAIRANRGLWETGNNTAAEIERNYAARVAGHAGNFDATFSS